MTVINSILSKNTTMHNFECITRDILIMGSKVLTFFNGGDSSTKKGYRIGTLEDDNSITWETTTAEEPTNGASRWTTIKLSNNKILSLSQDGNDIGDSFYAEIATFSNDTLTYTTDTTPILTKASVYDTPTYISLLGDSKVVFAYLTRTGASTRRVYVKVGDINHNTNKIEWGSATLVKTSNSGISGYIYPVSESKFYIGGIGETTTYYPDIRFCTVDASNNVTLGAVSNMGYLRGIRLNSGVLNYQSGPAMLDSETLMYPYAQNLDGGNPEKLAIRIGKIQEDDSIVWGSDHVWTDGPDRADSYTRVYKLNANTLIGINASGVTDSVFGITYANDTITYESEVELHDDIYNYSGPAVPVASKDEALIYFSDSSDRDSLLARVKVNVDLDGKIYVRPDTISGLYNYKWLRGKAKDGYIRPTLTQFYMSMPDFIEVSAAPTCLGGNITTYSDNGQNFKVHTFLASGNFEIQSSSDFNYDILIVGGGASGGQKYYAGGGGAGGFVYYKNKELSSGTYTVTVGATQSHGDGNSSTFQTLTTAVGGGIGGSTYSPYVNATDGGSGGGGATENNTPGQGTSNQGNAGGTGDSRRNSNASGGGGGGAKTAGHNGIQGTSQEGFGGAGYQEGVDEVYDFTTGTTKSFEINGLGNFYCGGGGGAHSSGTGSEHPYNLGGSGIGGTGCHYVLNVAATDGAANTGSGGGGASHTSGVKGTIGAGASGIVIVRYAI